MFGTSYLIQNTSGQGVLNKRETMETFPIKTLSFFHHSESRDSLLLREAHTVSSAQPR